MKTNPFTEGLEELASLQKNLGRPPKRNLVAGYVKLIVKRVGLRNDPRQRYFELLATSAILGREPMYWNYKPRKKGIRKAAGTSRPPRSS